METYSLNPLLGIALIFLAGYPAGLLVRALGLPAVTGNILVGVVLGPTVLGVFQSTTARDLEPITIFVMGLITVVIGGHLNYRRLWNAKRRILFITLCEVFLTGALVMAGTYFFGGGVWQVSVLLGAIALETAAGTTLAVVREARAKGLLVKTLLAIVALDNVLCIVAFSLAKAQVIGGQQPVGSAFVSAVFDLTKAACLGACVAAVLLILIRKKWIEPFSGLFIAILLTTGGAGTLGISPLLSSLVLGIFLGNSGRRSEEVLSSLESLEPVLLTCFFTLAGIDLHLKELGVMGFAGVVYFLARASGKTGGAFLGARFGTDLDRIRKNVGTAMLPHAGLAIGLLVILQGDPNMNPEWVSAITNVVLAAVVLNEIIGPPLLRRSILKAGELGKGRERLIEFLQEEYIKTPLKALDKPSAISELAEFLIRSHGIKEVTTEELIASVEERERSVSTAVGSGVALPHAKIPSGPAIMGAMGISDRGIDFGAPDGKPVHFIIMIATPKEHQELHLKVMAAIARIISDSEVRARLLVARTPDEAFDAIETEEMENYNYFLED